MGREIADIRRFRVWDNVPSWKPLPLGAKLVRSKWVDRAKGTGVTSRFCATEVAYDARGDTHAGTPPLCAIRYLLSSAATGRPRCVAIHDVTCAFLHVSMEGEPT